MAYRHTNSRGVTYFLHNTEVTLRGGKPQTIYFFAKVPKNAKGTPSDLPIGRVVLEIERTGFLSVRKRGDSASLDRPGDDPPDEEGPNEVLAADTIAGEGIIDGVGLVVDPRGNEYVVERFSSLECSPLSLPARILVDAIRDPEVAEADLQAILEAHPELIPGDYFEARPQIYLETNEGRQIPDFMLRPADDLWDVLEIKRPFPRVVTRAGTHERFSQQMAAAIQQTRDYSAALSDAVVRERLAERTGIDTLCPRIMLIAGASADSRTFRRLAADAATGIQMYTWEQVVEINRRRGRLC